MKAALRILLVVAAVAAGVGLAPAAEAAPRTSTEPQRVGVPWQQEREVELPPQWQEWDANGDGQVTIDELEALDEAGRDEIRAWVHDVLFEDYPDSQGREWAAAHFDSMAYLVLDVPGRGIGEQIREAPSEAIEAGREVVEDVGQAAADSALGAVARAIGDAASDLSGFLGEELARSGRPQLEAPWYQEHYRRMLGWAALLMLPLAFAAIGSAVARGDTSQVGHTIVQVPVAYLMGVLAVTLVSAAAGLSVAMARSLVPGIEESTGEIGTRVAGVLMVQPGMSMGLVLLVGLAIALAALATLMWLLFTEAAVYAVVLFFPLAFAGRVWPSTAAWGRRLLTVALALIGARVVIFALWGVAMSGLEDFTAGDVPLRSALALMALLVMTALAPTSALRLIPLVEGAESAPTPGGATQRALGVGYQAASLARSGGMLRGGGGAAGRGGSRLPVTSSIAGAAARVPAGTGVGAAAGRGSGVDPAGAGAPGRGRGGGGPPGGEGGSGSDSSPGAGGSGAPGGRSLGGRGSGSGRAPADDAGAPADRGRSREGRTSGSPGPRAPRAPGSTPRPQTPPPGRTRGRE